MLKQYGDLYLDTRRALLAKEDPQMAGFMARNLLCHVSGKTQEEFLTNRDLYASEEICRNMEAGVQRLLTGEPLAYVLGEWEFYGLKLQVNSNVLIPRDDTCAVAALAIKQAIFLDQSPRVLDLCCGSGCIGLAVASRVKDARVTLADISREALAVAKKHIVRQHLTARVSSVVADALGTPPAFLGKFDMIVSNPPYITLSEMAELAPELSYEPRAALTDEGDGLSVIRGVLATASASLEEGGLLLMEFGAEQGEAVSRLARDYSLCEVHILKDAAGHDRVLTACRGRF